MTPRLPLAALVLAACVPPVVASDAGPAPDAAGHDAGEVDAGTLELVQWTETGQLHHARYAQTATRLLDGRVLVAGGEDVTGAPTTSVELFDPDAGTWSELPPLPEPRSNHVAALLPDGRVLLAGGGRRGNNGIPAQNNNLSSTVIYDVSALAVLRGEAMQSQHSFAQAAVLDGGAVLVFGGGEDDPTASLAKSVATSELYDPATGHWSAGPPLQHARMIHCSAQLRDGSLASVGGLGGGFAHGTERLSAPGGWSSDPAQDRIGGIYGACIGLPSGAFFHAGGVDGAGFRDSVGLLPADGSPWRSIAPLPSARSGLLLTVLPSGRALMLSGSTCSQSVCGGLNDVAAYSEPDDTWTPMDNLLFAHAIGTLTWLSPTTFLVAGGIDGADGAHARCELGTVIRR